MKRKLLTVVLCAALANVSLVVRADEVENKASEGLHFAIEKFTVEGATLLDSREMDAIFAPYIGKNKDFSDVQQALEALENSYAKRGYSAVHVLLPEQELEQGDVHLRVVEGRFGKVVVKDNRYVTEANVLNALPSLRAGGVPKSKQVARELKFANENPARQLNVVLKAGEQDDQVDATVVVTDSKPHSWKLSLDNSGSPETGRTRLGLAYQYANLFNKDHVVGVQFQMSPERTNRVKVLGASYKIPFYQSGNSLEFMAGYSNVNSVIGGLTNFQGGGAILGVRFHHPLQRIGVFDPKLTVGLDWRDFAKVELISPPPPIPLFNEVVALPLSITYSVQGKFTKSDLNGSATLLANLPGMNKGRAADFAAYDTNPFAQQPKANYRLMRYSANYSQLIGEDWQIRASLNGQWSHDILVQGEQMRLGGADAVRGFSEGSEGGETGMRFNLEGYTPDWGKGDFSARALVFFDGGEVQQSASGAASSISSAGLGLRAGYADHFALRLDAARIINNGSDPLQRVGDWRAHLSLNATF